ncbi:MAG: class I SAM-dependent methyltransferase [Candidatus Hodarchaeota archaeon]
MVDLNLKRKFFKKINTFALRYGKFCLESDPLLKPLTGDRCVEYAFVIKNLLSLEKDTYKKVLDIGCFASPLTTIIKELGFIVDGIDLLPAPYIYEGVNYFEGDFLKANLKESFYDVVILCSTIEHFGLEGRYGSPSVDKGDLKAIEKVNSILRPGAILIITIPYGKEKTIKPWHRVYNKNSKLLKYLYDNFEVMIEDYYKNNKENKWVKCIENEASRVTPSEVNYALGLFVFKKKENI